MVSYWLFSWVVSKAREHMVDTIFCPVNVHFLLTFPFINFSEDADSQDDEEDDNAENDEDSDESDDPER